MPEKKLEFETDSEGNIITKPVTGWLSAAFVGMTVVLAIRYADSPEALEKGVNASIQFAMTPQQCIDLAERLTKLAKHITEDQPPLRTAPN